MKLVKEKCKKEGFEDYMNLYLTFQKDGKQYKVAVRPVSYYQRQLLESVASALD